MTIDEPGDVDERAHDHTGEKDVQPAAEDTVYIFVNAQL